MTTTAVTALAPRGAQAAVRALAAAFLDDPVSVWVTPDAGARAAGLPVYFDAVVRACLPHGCSAVTADGAGAALWSPPGVPLLAPEQEEELGGRAPSSGDPGRLPALVAALEQHRPQLPHHYLGYLGVLPGRQGQGLGAALLAPALRRCDAEGAPAYLEASTRDSARLYARHGFVETGRIDLPGGGPSLWPMWREPAAG